MKIALQSTFLQIAIELSYQFRSRYSYPYYTYHYTRGLIGTFNGNPSDDFLLPNGSLSVSTTSVSEEDIHNFGLACKLSTVAILILTTCHGCFQCFSYLNTHAGHVIQPESVFRYFGNETYATFNRNFDAFRPTFMSNRPSPPPDAVDICGGDRACVYDYSLTRDVRIAILTHNILTGYLNLKLILGKPADIRY